jgi:hexosaminidase
MTKIDTSARALAASLMLALCACAPQSPTTPAATTPAPPSVPAPAIALDNLVPLPAEVSVATGEAPVTIPANAVISACGEAPQRVAEYLRELAARTRKAAFSVDCNPAAAAAIRFTLDAAVTGDEAYRIDIGKGVADARARSEAGLFYAAVSLWQLLSAAAPEQADVRLAAGRIGDQPRYRWRGLMLDSVRHYQSPQFIRKMLDAMALHKLNTFHWHLTDDQGWRIEIKKYPRLTEVGAWRTPPGPAAAADIDPATGKARRYGGYYTQDEIRDIVKYAAERHITIVPEIDMPGHAQAAIAAYPALGTGETPEVSVDWGVHTYLLNVEESTFTFIDDVLTEVVALFPSTYIHIGGDEAAKDRWEKSPAIQARIRELGLSGPPALQSWFVQRLEPMLEKHGRKLIGWDEILEGGKLPASASVMSWRGTQGAVEAARGGHDVVLAPSPDLYLDNLQSDAADEPSGRPYLVTLEKLYGFEPTPAELDEAQAKHVLGAQVNVWVEHMRTTARVEHAVFPRLAAIAEVNWSARALRDWHSFLARLPAQLQRYRALDIGYADSAVAVRAKLAPAAQPGQIQATLSNQIALGQIHYTTDGSEPRADSPRYAEPLQLAEGTTLRATAFVDGKPLAKPLNLALDATTLRRRSGAELAPCSDKSGLKLRVEDDAPVQGERPFLSADIFDACYIWKAASLSPERGIEVDVGSVPYNFQLWHDQKHVVLRKPASAEGELEIRRDGCAGAPWLTVPLKAASANPGITTLRAALPAEAAGMHDLCFVFTRPDTGTLWAVHEVRL